MWQGKLIAVVIPAYKVEAHIAGVIRGIPGWVDQVIIVDDASPDGTSAVVASQDDPRVVLLRHAKNRGVGGAMVTGYTYALRGSADIVVKMDGDGQMDPAYLPRLLDPLVTGRADYVKGNRFFDFQALRTMPTLRRIGNTALTFLAKIASGYWNISDPTNGYTAIHRKALELLDIDALHLRYFFENSLLVRLNVIRAVVKDVPIPALYGGERSSMNLFRVVVTFPGNLFLGVFRRVYWRYFFYDLTVTSIFLVAGFTLVLFGGIFGGFRWYQSYMTGIPQTAGTVLLAALPFILGFQLILQAIVLDVQDRPSESVSARFQGTTSIAADAPTSETIPRV